MQKDQKYIRGRARAQTPKIHSASGKYLNDQILKNGLPTIANIVDHNHHKINYENQIGKVAIIQKTEFNLFFLRGKNQLETKQHCNDILT